MRTPLLLMRTILCSLLSRGRICVKISARMLPAARVEMRRAGITARRRRARSFSVVLSASPAKCLMLQQPEASTARNDATERVVHRLHTPRYDAYVGVVTFRFAMPADAHGRCRQNITPVRRHTLWQHMCRCRLLLLWRILVSGA